MKKNILLTDKFPPHKGGTSIIFYNLYKDTDTLVINFTPIINIPKIRMPLVYIFIFIYTFFYCFIKNKKKLFIHAGQVLETGLTAYIIKKIFKIPYIVHTFGEEISICSKTKFKKYFMLKVLLDAEKIFSISNFTKGKLIELGQDENKIQVLYPGVDKTKFTVNNERKMYMKKKLGINENEFVLLSLGRIIKRKGYETMVNIFNDLCEKHNNLRYLILGDGLYKKELEKIILKTKNKHKIILLNSVPHEQTVLYYEICDLFIMLANELDNGDLEGFGLVLLEAQICGKPVIAGKSGGTIEALKDKETGFLVDSKNKEDILKKINILINDKKLYRQMSLNAQVWVNENFTWEKTKDIIKKTNNKY